MKKLYSATEILGMNLPGLPKSKPAFLAKAEKEKWFYETKVGLGGIRKMFQIPTYYQPGYKPYAGEPGQTAPAKSKSDSVTSIVEGADQIAAQAVDAFGTKIDPQRLSKAIQIVERYLEEKKIYATAERKSDVVVVVYNFLKNKHGQEEIDQLLKLVA
ncbi:hypothetical protein [Undibacterium sp. Ren11W]|uniref:hypothetical protein n=1 Tax=Undibacterium sp. Ren11W TaxID=3413045 RepID=UPI003BEFF3F3